jgi:hypothetical protein
MSTVYNQALFEVAHRRMRQAPLELTETDFAQLGIIDPTLETKARAGQRDAQLTLVHTHRPALQTKAASSEDRSRRPITRKQLERFADQFGDALVDVLKRTVDPLKEQIAELKARTLELEAAAAAREEVSHADR